MNKHKIKDLIYKHFEPKDVGIGVLNCIHEDKDVDKLAENLVNLFSIPVVINWVAVEERLPTKYENVITRNENNIVSTDQISDNGWVYEELCKSKVTHWKPMPEPPCC